MVQRALTRLLLPLVTAATALLSLPACVDGITKTLEPAVSCQEPCDLSFSSLRPQAKNPGEVTIESVGDAPLRILAVDIEGAPASVKFKDVTVTDLISRSMDVCHCITFPHTPIMISQLTLLPKSCKTSIAITNAV